MKYISIFFLILISYCKGFTQSTYQIAGQSIPQLKAKAVLKATTFNFKPDYKISPSTTAPSLTAIFKNNMTTSTTTMPKAWAYKELAFFCKIEVQMEKAAKLPVKFRIGEVQQVEKMEGKLKSY